MKIASTLLTAGLLASFFATAAFSSQGKGPCAVDVATLCKEVRPDGGRILACLKAHEATVSATCKAHLAEIKGKGNGAQQACHDDMEQFCSEVKPGRGRIQNCLKQHEAQLADECRDKIEHFKVQ